MTSAVQEFSTTLLSILNNGATSLMISIGHRTGLFDVMATLPPSTIAQIASASNLNERYVREWLNSMTVSGIVKFDPAAQEYTLPQEHARFLTRKHSGENMAVFSQFLGMMGAVEDQIVECFYKGGGVPYSAFTRFHEVMAEESGRTLIPIVADQMIGLMPGMRESLEKGAVVLDIGCGRGLVSAKLASRFPNSQFVGYDLSTEAISFARENVAALKLNNVRYEVRDVTSIAEQDTFDLITAFDAIHDQAQPLKVLKNAYGALKPGGTFLMQDIDAASEVDCNLNHPISPFLYAISCMHCMTVSLAADGEGLGTMWGRRVAQDYLKRAGFESVRIEKFEHDIQNCVYIALK